MQEDFCKYKLVSLLSFLIFNWVFLLVLLLKIYRIRHIHDKTLIKQEVATIIGVLVPFSIVQYTFWLLGQHIMETYISSDDGKNWGKINYLTYWTIIIRDGGVQLITNYYCYRVNKNEIATKTLMNLQTAEPTEQLTDFDMILDSAIPFKLFSNYLQTEQPQHLPYFQIVQLCDLIKSEVTEMQQLKVHRDHVQKQISKKSRNPIRGELEDFSGQESNL